MQTERFSGPITWASYAHCWAKFAELAPLHRVASKSMRPELLRNLRARAESICRQWETLLRVEPVNSPLANPDALAHLISGSLEEIFEVLAESSRAPISLAAARDRLPACDCGNNPYLAYFTAGEQALVEGLVLVQAELPPAKRTKSDVTELICAVRRLARAEIDTFCAVCVHRGRAPQCRHAPKGILQRGR